jgi:hypothetical protein
MAFDWYKMIQEHGANKEAIRALQAAKNTLEREVKSLQESRAYIRGGWFVITVVAAVAGSVGAILSRAFWH